jgi:hypothetical protein
MRAGAKSCLLPLVRFCCSHAACSWLLTAAVCRSDQSCLDDDGAYKIIELADDGYSIQYMYL